MGDLPRAVSESDKLIGDVLANRYLVESRLGEGAMGTVYKARHVKVGRAFAVKVLHPRLLNEEKLLQRFQRESELAGKLRHPNVIGVVDVGETPDGMHYMVMDFASGPDLATLLSDAPFPAPRVIALVRQLCDGLYHAHEHGLIHRDFKPENVIVETDSEGNEIPRIVDFGIAILQEAGDSTSNEGRLTTNGLVLGTPHYMAPEQAVADPIDHRIDLFALGIVVYEMLTGRLPFDGTGAEVARANLVLDPPAMAKRVPHLDVDPLLEAFTRKLMSKNRNQRPPTAKAARELIELIENDRPAAAAVLGVPLDDRRQPMPTQPVREVREAREAVDEHVAPPIVAAAAAAITAPKVERTPRSTSLEEPLPWDRGKKRRVLVIGSIAGAALLAGAIAFVMHSGGKDDHDARVAVIAPVDAANVAIVPTTPAVIVPAIPSDAAEAPPPIAIDAAEAAAIVPTPTTPTHKPQHPVTHPDEVAGKPFVPTPVPTPIPTPVPTHPVTPAVPESTETTAKALLQQYSAVGAQLKALEDKQGTGATAELWPRYRLIRINDALTSPAKRADTAAILTRLHHDIAAHTK